MCHPEPPLLPADVLGRARVRAIALDIACEIHPLDDLRVLRFLVKDLGVSEDDKNRWYRHWVETGLETVERQLASSPATGQFCHGDTPGFADCVLVPQVHNAQRMNCPARSRADGDADQRALHGRAAFSTTQASACPDAA